MNPTSSLAVASDDPTLKGAKRFLAGSVLFIFSAGQDWTVTRSATVLERGPFGRDTVEVFRNSYSGAEYLPLGSAISNILIVGVAIWMFVYWRDQSFTAVPKVLVWGGAALAAWTISNLLGNAALAGIGNQQSGLMITFAGFVGALGALLLLLGAMAYRGGAKATTPA